MAKKVVEYDTNNGLFSENIYMEKEEFEDNDYLDDKVSVSETTVNITSNDFNVCNIKEEIPSKVCANVAIKSENNSIDIKVQPKDEQLCELENSILCDDVKIKNEDHLVDFIKVESNNAQQCKVDGNITVEDVEIKDEICVFSDIKDESTDEQPSLTQCKTCGNYLDEDENLEYHQSFCSKNNIRRRVSPAGDYQVVEEEEEDENTSAAHNQNETTLNSHMKWKESLKFERDESNVRSSKVFTTRKRYKRNDNDIRKTYKCSRCSYETNYERNVKFHVTTKHWKEATNRGSYREYMTEIAANLKAHKNNKHLNETTECVVCNFNADDKDSLMVHIEREHPERTIYKCSDCYYKTLYIGALRAHINTKHREDRIYKCLVCEFSTGKEAYLVNHASARHYELPIYNCSECEYKSVYEQNLNKHVKEQHDDMIAFNCSKCTFETYSQWYLRAHALEDHGERLTYNCSECDYKTHGRSQLSWHVKTMHRNRTVYACSKCQFEGKYPDLRAHENACHRKRKKFFDL